MKAQFEALKRDTRYGAPKAAWVKETRAALLSDISQNKKTAHTAQPSWSVSFSYLFPQSMLAPVRSLAVVALVIGLAVGGWLTSVSASTNSLPGDLLYGVKLASEKTQLTVAKVTGNKESAVQISLKSASNRASEIKQIAKKQPKEVQKVKESLEKNLSDAAEDVADMRQTDVTKAAALAKEMTETTAVISGNLRDAAKEVEKTEEGNEEATKEIVEASKTVEDAEIEAIGVVVEGNPEEAKELIAKKTESLLGENEEAKLELEQLEKSLEEKKTASEEGEETATEESIVVEEVLATSTVPEVVSTTTPAGEMEEGVIEKLEETSKIAKDQTLQIDEGAKETLILSEDQQLQEAVEKLKQLGDIKEETQEAIGELKEQLNIEPEQPPVEEESPQEPTEEPVVEEEPVQTEAPEAIAEIEETVSE